MYHNCLMWRNALGEYTLCLPNFGIVTFVKGRRKSFDGGFATASLLPKPLPNVTVLSCPNAEI